MIYSAYSTIYLTYAAIFKAVFKKYLASVISYPIDKSRGVECCETYLLLALQAIEKILVAIAQNLRWWSVKPL